MKLSLKQRLCKVNKELWLVRSMISVILTTIYLTAGILLTASIPQPLYAQENKKDIQLQSIAFKLFQEKENLKILRSKVVETDKTDDIFNEQPLSYYSLLESLDRIYLLCGYEYEILEIAPKLKKEFKPKFYQRRDKQLLQTIDEVKAELNTITMLFKETEHRSVIILVNQAKKSIQSILSLMEYGVKILEPESN